MCQCKIELINKVVIQGEKRKRRRRKTEVSLHHYCRRSCPQRKSRTDTHIQSEDANKANKYETDKTLLVKSRGGADWPVSSGGWGEVRRGVRSKWNSKTETSERCWDTHCCQENPHTHTHAQSRCDSTPWYLQAAVSTQCLTCLYGNMFVFVTLSVRHTATLDYWSITHQLTRAPTPKSSFSTCWSENYNLRNMRLIIYSWKSRRN